jgi:hypothetical protein
LWAILYYILPVFLNARINGWSLGGELGEAADPALEGGADLNAKSEPFRI